MSLLTSSTDLTSFSQPALTRMTTLLSHRVKQLEKDHVSATGKQEKLRNEWLTLVPDGSVVNEFVIATNKDKEGCVLEAEAERLEARVLLLRRVVLNKNELKNLSSTMDPNIKNDEILGEIMKEAKSIKQLQMVLKKVVGKNAIRRGYKEVKKEKARNNTLNGTGNGGNAISSDGGGRLKDYTRKDGTISFSKTVKENNDKLQEEDEY